MRFESSPDGRMMLPPGWRPPASFTVTIHYRDPERPPDSLWMMPYTRANGVTGYLAVGPAGQPLEAYMLADIDRSQVPPGSAIQLVTENTIFGAQVYGQLRHTLN